MSADQYPCSWVDIGPIPGMVLHFAACRLLPESERYVARSLLSVFINLPSDNSIQSYKSNYNTRTYLNYEGWPVGSVSTVQVSAAFR